MRTTRPAAHAALAAVALSLAALLGACGGGGDDDTGDVATLGSTDDGTGDGSTDGTTADGDTASESPTDPQDAALAYAACMREHGIDMPDPEFTDEGGMTMAIGGGPGEEIDEEAIEEAQTACQPIMDNAQPSEEDMPSDEEIQEMQDRALAAAECMREHGYDWPDPEFGEGGRISQEITSDAGFDPEDPQFQADQQECMGGEGPMIAGGPGGGPVGGSTGSGGDAPERVGGTNDDEADQ